MHKTVIRNAAVPPPIWKIVRPLLVQIEQFFPPWLQMYTVIWDDSDVNGSAKTTVHYPYRRADLGILPNFLSTGDRQIEIIAHEVAHLYTSPQMESSMEIVRSMVSKEDPARKLLLDAQVDLCEAMTCDLALSFLKTLKAQASRL